MGYLVIETQEQGQIVIDGSRVLSIIKGKKNNDYYLDLILGVQKNNPNKNDIVRLEFSGEYNRRNFRAVQCSFNTVRSGSFRERFAS